MPTTIKSFSHFNEDCFYFEYKFKNLYFTYYDNISNKYESVKFTISDCYRSAIIIIKEEKNIFNFIKVLKKSFINNTDEKYYYISSNQRRIYLIKPNNKRTKIKVELYNIKNNNEYDIEFENYLYINNKDKNELIQIMNTMLKLIFNPNT